MSTRRAAIAIVTMTVLALVAACSTAEPTATPAPPSPTPIPPTDVPESDVAPTLPAPQPLDAAWDEREVFGAGLIEEAQGALDLLPGASVYYIDLLIPADFLTLKGHEQVRYTNQEEVPLDQVYFRLFPNIAGGAATVSALQVDGQDVEPGYELENSAIRVPLPESLQPGEQAVIQMDLTVKVAQEMGGNYGLFGYFDGILVLDEFYPVIPVYDDEGWNVEVTPPNGDATYFDASFYLVRVTAPDDLVLVASGIEVEREHLGNEQVVTFAAGPARDFYLAASEEYTVISKAVGDTTVNSYAPPELMEGAELALKTAAGALESFSERFGLYPYTEFDVVSTPMLAMGIEYPGMTGINLDSYTPDVEIAGLPSQVILESTVAHEVAHQWFYNIVGNDQVDEPWLDEAHAQYATGLYYTDTYGPAAAQRYRESWNQHWGAAGYAAIPIGMSTRDYAANEYGPIVYGRGPLFVAALAEEMGQETFDQFLSAYCASHRWGIGTGETFRQLAEQHCQCDLTDLFEEWVYEESRASAPTLSPTTVTVCAAGCDFTTIQAAIDAASAGATIQIGDPTHTEAAITVDKDVTIQGQGAASTIVQAHASVEEATERVFYVPAGVTATMRDVTIRHGNPISDPDSGGGITNEGTLTLENSIISDNIGNGSGGIVNEGELTLVNCVVRDNAAIERGDYFERCGSGGGIKNRAGLLTLVDSTVSGNSAEGNGGGIFVSCAGVLELINSTISGNSAARGGGIYVKGRVELAHATIGHNSAANNGGGIYLEGAGEQSVAQGLLDYTNTIIANNSAGLGKHGTGDCLLADYGKVGVNVNNLVGDGSCSPDFSGDPMLGPLTGNGDLAPFHALLPGSPALDAIPAEECTVSADQRGVSRPQGAGCDIGAFELQ